MRATMAAVAMAMSAAASVCAATADVGAKPPRPFTATYEVTYRGLGAGSLVFDFSRAQDGQRYTFETKARPSLLARFVVSAAATERSLMDIGPNGVRPLEWRLDDGRSGEEHDARLHFDWERGVVNGQVEGETVNAPTEPGLQDRSSLQIAVSAALLAGREPGTIALIDDRQVKRYEYTRKRSEELDTPLGRLEVVLYESTRPGSSRVSRLWLAPKLDYAPARAEQIRKGKVETVMVLKEWREQ